MIYGLENINFEKFFKLGHFEKNDHGKSEALKVEKPIDKTNLKTDIIITPPKLQKMSSLKFNNLDDAHKWGKEKFDEWEKTLCEEKRESISNYSKIDFSNINKLLRGQGSFFYGDNRQTMESVSEALSYSKIPENITVYRGASLEILGEYKNLKYWELSNKEIYEEGFLSTSLIPDIARKFTKNVFLVIEVPEKTFGGAYIEEISQKEEAEVLFDKGQKLIIKGAHKEFMELTDYKTNKKYNEYVMVLKCELLGEKNSK